MAKTMRKKSTPRGKGRPFVKGDKRAGRPKGVPNKVTLEVREAAASIVDDPVYRANLASRARRGKLAPAIESMLWHYAKGKPKETVEHSGPGGVPLGIVVEFVRTRDGGGE